jgi:hypothetical protein
MDPTPFPDLEQIEIPTDGIKKNSYQLKMLAFSRLPPLVNGATPVESYLLLFMNDHKRLGFDFMSSLIIVLT